MLLWVALSWISVITAALVGSHSRTSSSSCLKRKELSLYNAAVCGKPREYPMRLPLPDGYIKMTPSVVIVPQCQDHYCHLPDRHCVANNTVTKKFKVELINRNGAKECGKFTVPAARSCECRCIMSQARCGANQVFNVDKCRCDCPRTAILYCYMLMKKYPGRHMLHPRSCGCYCMWHYECGTGEIWHNDICQCVDDDYFIISDNLIEKIN